MAHALTRFFAPRSVAFIGATEDLSKFGGRCMRQLIDFGFDGAIYPINPKRDSVFGRRCYPSLAALPEAPDHVGIVLPGPAVAGALAECGAKGVPFATVFSAGFGEQGTEAGRAAQAQLVSTARAAGLRFMGPNCNGLINFTDKFALTSTGAITGGALRPAGDVAVISQSGGAGQVNTMWRAQEAGLGISVQVSCGNDADLDLLDYVEFAVEHPQTKVVLVLAERISSGARLRQVAARAAERGKPIVMIKFGRTEAGSKAAASHTGAITGADAVFDAAARQLGLLRVEDCPELYEAAMLLRQGRRPAGTGVAALSISGGNLVLLAETGAGLGLHFPGYTPETTARLQPLLPGFTGTANPTDLSAGAIGAKDLFAQATRLIRDDPGVDTMVPVLTIAPAADIRATCALAAESAKPMPILWSGKCSDDAGITTATLVAEGHAVYRDPLPCLRAVSLAARHAGFLRRFAEPAPQRPAGMDQARAATLLKAERFSEADARALLACYGLHGPREALVASAAEAVSAAAGMGGPVALKVASPDLPHKTEAGAVKLGVAGAEAVAAAHADILANARAFKPGARIDGVLVQEMVTGGQEMLLGITPDATFGPVLAVGFGGIHVEVLKDIAFRLPAIGPAEAEAMLRELRLFPLLGGVRGAPASDVPALVDAICRFGWLAADLADAPFEVEVNPLIVLPAGRGVRVVDALVLRR